MSSDNIRYVNSANIEKRAGKAMAYVPSLLSRALSSWILLMLLGVLIASLMACSVPLADGFEGDCASDADCAVGLSCLHDIDLNRAYCAASCLVSADCPATESCRRGYRSMEGSKSETGMCVHRVRSCMDQELCNGLDDDCDGVIDGLDCSPISACLDDAVCGAFVCSVTENFPFALCVPRLENTKSDFEPCTDGSECRNGLCETGICSPLCRRNFIGLADSCGIDYTCAKAGAAVGVAPHNVCQPNCKVNSDCPEGQLCVWRDIHEGGDSHALVCSVPAPDRKALGEACRREGDMGDDDCASGLCYGLVCTRSCAGAGASCADVGPGFVCRSTQLYYGTEEFMVDVCVEPEP